MYEKIEAYVSRLVEGSTPERTLWNVEKLRQGKEASWNYIDGCMLTALLGMAELTGERTYFDFVKACIDNFVGADGSIRTYDEGRYNLDDVNEGRVLFELYAKTGEEKYRAAAKVLRGQLERQPRTFEGSFWHKLIYPDQVWLDGIYMAQPFYALYELSFGSGDISDTLRQIETVHARMRDKNTGLYFHGYDASRHVFWADSETGCSRSLWLRSIGWFAVALADLAEILPRGKGNERVRAILSELMAAASRFEDPGTGMYYQVVDRGADGGNYLETSGSSMSSAGYVLSRGSGPSRTGDVTGPLNTTSPSLSSRTTRRASPRSCCATRR